MARNTLRLKIDLKTLIYSNGYNIKSFAQAVGVERETMQRIVAGKPNIHGNVIFTIAKLLGRRPDEIWELIDQGG
ncbi:helix-turn-helix transcriptional regulator [Desulfotomaculum sp. 1211_IL3151]|uniref:helix-turn-helix transcriptional regulator n=1 Tax=Desulfotomaculum sp. 1211_IL3151 TaxID=3084055 RepID=UPI002FDB4B74